MGRQPWVVYGLLKTSDARSPLVGSTSIILTPLGYTLLYGMLSSSVAVCSCARSPTAPNPSRAGAPRPRGQRRGEPTWSSPTEGADPMREPNFLQTLWFPLIGVLWVGYFVLEGFDFGVGMLLRAIGRDETTSA